MKVRACWYRSKLSTSRFTRISPGPSISASSRMALNSFLPSGLTFLGGFAVFSGLLAVLFMLEISFSALKLDKSMETAQNRDRFFAHCQRLVFCLKKRPDHKGLWPV